MIITVNGESREVDAGTTIEELLNTLGFDGNTLVVQQNDDIIEQAAYGSTNLNADDQIELVRFVGGG